MKVFDQIGFFSEVSRLTRKSLMLVSVDPDLLDQNGRAFERSFSMLAPEALDEIRISGAAILEFETEGEARTIHAQMTAAHGRIGDIGLYAVLFLKGASVLGISEGMHGIEASFADSGSRHFG